MVQADPLPAFSGAGGVAKLTICGETIDVCVDDVGAPTIHGLQTFKPFKRLPGELKAKILGYVANGRTIHAIELPVLKSATPPAGQDASLNATINLAFKFIGAGIPSVFLICKEIKELAGSMGYRPMFKVHGSEKKVYFNPYIDTLHLHTSFIRDNLVNQVAVSKSLVDPLELALIRYLKVPHFAFALHQDKVVNDIASMPRLEILTLSGKFDVYPTQPDFTLKWDFEKNEEGGGVKAVADIPGNRVEGDKAVSISGLDLVIRELTLC